MFPDLIASEKRRFFYTVYSQIVRHYLWLSIDLKKRKCVKHKDSMVILFGFPVPLYFFSKNPYSGHSLNLVFHLMYLSITWLISWLYYLVFSRS